MLAAIVICGSIGLFGGPGLVADDPGPAPGPSSEDPAAPEPGSDSDLDTALLALGVLLAGLASAAPGAALGLRPPPGHLVVFVPGHGQPHARQAFADMVKTMGLGEGDARYFEYGWVTGDADPVRASQRAPVGPAAGALNAYLGGLAAEGRPIWLVGFSKGGAVIAETIAAWDDGAYGPSQAVRGATLLDPPLARGVHGLLQSAGRLQGWLPDDGGYDPVECAFVLLGCRDRRRFLGDAAGVEVLVVRNPKAGITSFSDRPDGLRVLDAPDLGPGFWQQALANPLALPGRVVAAHHSVLSDPAVARCVVTEMWAPGSCAFGGAPSPPAWQVPLRPWRGVRTM